MLKHQNFLLLPMMEVFFAVERVWVGEDLPRFSDTAEFGPRKEAKKY
jgi:hypothetical protein